MVALCRILSNLGREKRTERDNQYRHRSQQTEGKLDAHGITNRAEDNGSDRPRAQANRVKQTEGPSLSGEESQAGLIQLDLSDNNKIQDEQRDLLKEWCLAAGVALELDLPKPNTKTGASHRNASFSAMPGTPHNMGKIRNKNQLRVQKGASFRNKNLLKAAKQQQKKQAMALEA